MESDNIFPSVVVCNSYYITKKKAKEDEIVALSVLLSHCEGREGTLYPDKGPSTLGVWGGVGGGGGDGGDSR